MKVSLTQINKYTFLVTGKEFDKERGEVTRAENS